MTVSASDRPAYATPESAAASSSIAANATAALASAAWTEPGAPGSASTSRRTLQTRPRLAQALVGDEREAEGRRARP